jgi:hypothetical protein
MFVRTVRIALVAVALLAVSATSARACHLFDRFCGRPTTTFYAPVAAPAPVCCPQPQVVNYMPQTCYRTVYVNTPVVAYQPATACDPCGRATTVMRPVTTFVTQARLVPYTTYRAVAAPAQPCCATAAPVAQTFYAPAVSTVPAAAPACCAPASATYTPAPAVSTYNPAPVSSAITTSTPTPTLQSVTPAPGPTAYPSAPSAAPPSGENRTFESSPSDVNPAESRMLLPPRNSSLSTRPHGLDPDLEDRTTAIPLRGSNPVRQASLVVPAKAEASSADGGWRAAAR